MKQPGDNGESQGAHPSFPSDAVRAHLEKVLASKEFIHSDSLRRFLSYSVEQTISGQSSGLKESLLGAQLFGRGDNFDPRLDPIVRVQAGKLRNRLQRYYDGEGCTDALVIEFPKGGYVPVFHPRVNPPKQKRSRRWKPIWFTAGSISLVTLSALTWQRWPRAYAVPLTFTQLTFATESTSAFPSISGDGKLVVFASDRGASGNLNIFVQAVGGEGPVQLTHSPSKDRQTDISPDGTKIVYESDRDGGGLYVLSLLSRAETRVAERGFDPRFSPDGSRIAYQGPNGRLFTVAAMGGLPQPVQSAISPALFPAWTPDGKRLLATVRKGDTGYDWMVFPLDGGRAFSTGAEAVFRRQQIGNTTHPPIPGGWIGDRIIFSAGQRDSASLWELPLSTKSLRVSGAARRLTFGPGANTYPRVAPLAAGNSRMVFVNENIVAQICSFAPEPRQSGAGLVLERLTQDSSLVPGGSPQLSADGSKLAYCSTRLGNPDVWLKNMKTGVETAVAANPWPEQQPLISPDGSRVAYVSRPDHGDAIHIWDAASGANRKLCDGCGTPVEWMPDGQRLLAAAGDPPRFQMFNATSGESQNLLPALKGTVAGAAVSPDGHWLAVTAHGVPEGCPETFIAPFEVKSDGSCKDWIPLTGLGAIWGLRWSPTGDRLYFFSSRDGTRCVWGLRVRLPGHGQTGQPFAVQHFHRYQPGPWSNSGISIAGRRLVVWFQYSQSSIWMADLR